VLLSILIPSVPERADKLKELLEKLKPRAKSWPGQVEVLSLIDFRTMSLGEKRNRLMRIAEGKYVIHLDDDDRLTDDALDVLMTRSRT
jgi:glycosyltransferase involved in cell wall biosynthesis